MKLSWPVWLNKNILGFSVASTMSDASHEIVPLVLPVLIAQLVGKDSAPPYVALIGGTSTAVASISGLYAGRYSDHLTNRKPLIVFGYFITGALVGLLAFATHWFTVFLLVTGAWIGRGIISAPRSAIIADSTDKAFYGRAFGFRQACDTIGSVLGPLIVYFLAGWSPHTLFLVALIPGILACILIYLLITDVPHTTQNSDQPFSWLFIVNQSLPQAFYSLLWACALFSLGSFNKSLLVLRMQEILSPGSTTAAALSTVTLLYIFRNITQTIASYSMGALSDKIGRLIPLAVGAFGFFGLMSLLLAWQTTSLVSALLIFFLSGFSAGTYMSLQKSLAADVLPENLRGTGYGIINVVDSIGELIASIMLGLVWSLIGPDKAFLSAALISFLSILALLPLKGYYSQRPHNTP